VGLDPGHSPNQIGQDYTKGTKILAGHAKETLTVLLGIQRHPKGLPVTFKNNNLYKSFKVLEVHNSVNFNH
jgi:hypothetical protein